MALAPEEILLFQLECRALRLGRGFVGRIFRFAVLLSLVSGAASAQKPPLLPEKDVAALAQELSGETAKRNLEGITRFHRQRGSQGFHSAAELVAERARAYGLERRRDPAISRRRENLLRHAALASALGRGVRGVVGSEGRSSDDKDGEL